MYFVVMVVGDKHGYVVTTDDVDKGGWVDADPIEDFGFETEEDAVYAAKELMAYADSKGYVNAKFYIE